jgi:hypothetical protein
MKYDYISFMSASQIVAASVLTISSTLSGFIMICSIIDLFVVKELNSLEIIHLEKNV